MQAFVIISNVGIKINAECECKELIDKGKCDEGFIWNPSNWECECDKLCEIGKYLNYTNCKCRKELISKLVEECSENTRENKMIYNETLNDYGKVCNSGKIHIVLFVISFLLFIEISGEYFYFHWYFKMDNTIINTSVKTETAIY